MMIRLQYYIYQVFWKKKNCASSLLELTESPMAKSMLESMLESKFWFQVFVTPA